MDIISILSCQRNDLSISSDKLAFVKPTELSTFEEPLIVELARSYCLCDYNMPCYCHCETPTSFSPLSFEFKSCFNTSLQGYPELQNQSRDSSSTGVPSRGDRTIYLQSKLARLYQYLENINDPFKILVFRRPKVNCRTPTISARRSRYTGVFKNGLKWQALINIGNKKTYIQTYSTQEEAARAFDLMSLLLNRMKAVTNYSYSKEDIFSLFSKYSDIVNKFCS
ncbi:unnamed protein product [Moneuplotes crassus]|uniref:AP2/ERF domain-containing protein n=1 Tax=Euplotes crassus TaxID=5936 RepID=A0AAD1XE83_EUPCR|nr:unnamed protein product [Moneuplotes crassus]